MNTQQQTKANRAIVQPSPTGSRSGDLVVGNLGIVVSYLRWPTEAAFSGRKRRWRSGDLTTSVRRKEKDGDGEGKKPKPTRRRRRRHGTGTRRAAEPLRLATRRPDKTRMNEAAAARVFLPGRVMDEGKRQKAQ